MSNDEIFENLAMALFGTKVISVLKMKDGRIFDKNVVIFQMSGGDRVDAMADGEVLLFSINEVASVDVV